MNCPVCSKAMGEEDFGVKVKVNVCKNGCKSIWFPHGALQELDQNNEGVGQALEAALNSPRVNKADRGPVQCPICHIPMHRHLYARSHEVNVDECYSCEAFFLDSGDLSVIRKKAMTDEEVDVYTNKLVGNISGRPNEVSLDKGIIAENVAQYEKREEAIHKFGQILHTHYWDRSG